MSVLVLLIVALLIGVLAAFSVHPSDPDEPWWHRLACLAPLSLIAGAVLAIAGAAA